jgi:hypothetical protein
LGDISLSSSPAKSPLEESGVEPEVQNEGGQAPNISASASGPEPEAPTTSPSLTPPENVQVAPAVSNEPLPQSLEPVESADQTISETPIQSPVSTPGVQNDSPIPAGAADPMNMPSATPSMPDSISPSAATSDQSSSLSDASTPDSSTPEGQSSGEPSEAPDTDEFLQSILDGKSAPQAETSAQNAPVADAISPEPTDAESAAPEIQVSDTAPTLPETEIAPPAESAQAIDSAISSPFQEVSPAEATPALTELSSDPLENNSAPTEAPTAAVTPEAVAAPDLSQTMAPTPPSPLGDASSQMQAAGIDSLTSATSPLTDSPDQSAVADIFSKKPNQKKSLLRFAVLIVLVIAILGGIYYVAKTFFFSPSSTPAKSAQSGLGTATPASSTVALTGDTARKADLLAIQQALLNLYSANGKYPLASDYVKLNQSGNVVEKELVPNYLSKLPTDPDKTRTYQYKSDGTTFTLTAVLDNQSDPGVSVENGVALYKIDQSTDVASASAASNSSVVTSPVASGSSGVSAASLATGTPDPSLTSQTSTDTSSNLF